ncbi:major facilitator superfamily domain-containing protein [Aspergillus avenaceus]|uniref:Major facilitator superfamily domain-containing protein n=1 Tax=Aspergillus avenaceus TaxID=36643 RepID=A0A5N6U7T4_ASPAV|nr:major facilitator superfamily domain-containing protein [Aspergillus avenaceus]
MGSHNATVFVQADVAGQNYTKHGVLVIALATIVAAALPSIAGDLGSADGYAWVSYAYLLAETHLLPLWSNLSVIWGRRNAILLANTLFFAGSLVCALAINMSMLVTGRYIQGAGAAGLVPLVNIILSELFTIKKRAKHMAITNTSWAVAAAIGPLLGGALAEHVTWRWCFYLNLPLNGIIFILLLISLQTDQQNTSLPSSIKAIDWTIVSPIIDGTHMLLLGLQFGATGYPWDSIVVICWIILGISMMTLSIITEWYVPSHRPGLSIELFKHRSPLTAFICSWIHGVISIAPYYLHFFFQTDQDASPALSSIHLLPMVLTAAATTIATGTFTQKTGNIVEPIRTGFLITTLGLSLFTNLDEHSSRTKLTIYQIVFGLGLGANYSAPLLAVQRAIQTGDIAIATTTVAFSHQLGSALSLVISGIILQSRVRRQQPRLLAGLGPDATAQLPSPGMQVPSGAFMRTLTGAQRNLVRVVYASSIRPMYHVYVVLSGVAFLLGFLIST